MIAESLRSRNRLRGRGKPIRAGSSGPVYLEKKVLVSFGSATKAFAVANWNFAHTNDPADTYELNNLINSDGATINGLNIDVTTALSDQANGGSASAGIGAASEFPANAAREYWYPVSGARAFAIEVPAGGLGVTLGKIKILSNVTIGTPPHVTSITIGGVTKTIADSSGATIDEGNILEWTDVDFSSAVTVTITDGTGISAINAMILYYYVQA